MPSLCILKLLHVLESEWMHVCWKRRRVDQYRGQLCPADTLCVDCFHSVTVTLCCRLFSWHMMGVCMLLCSGWTGGPSWLWRIWQDGPDPSSCPFIIGGGGEVKQHGAVAATLTKMDHGDVYWQTFTTLLPACFRTLANIAANNHMKPVMTYISAQLS